MRQERMGGERVSDDTTTFLVRLPHWLNLQLDREAKRQDRSKGSLVRLVLAEYTSRVEEAE